MNTIDFIKIAKQIHGDKYDYSKLEYVNPNTKVCIICNKLDYDGYEHGEFWQRPYEHIDKKRKCGCPKCSNRVKYTSETFTRKAKSIHGDKYDYSKVEYINKKNKILLKCNTCGYEFEQLPLSHLQGFGCKKCASHKCSLRQTATTEEFIEKLKFVHGDKYDYSKVKYVNDKTKVCIICKEHGEFYQRPSSHLNGIGCKKCAVYRKILTTNEFIEKAKIVHGDKYDYSKVVYKTTYDDVCILCPIHGEFWQKPINHLQKRGCQKCADSSMETEIRIFLEENNIFFEQQKKFKWLKSKQNFLRLDFYLPDYKVAIECQGEQHFKPIEYFGGEENFEHIKCCDKLKNIQCENNKIKLLYYSTIEKENYSLGEIITNKNNLLTLIKNE